MQTWCKIKKLFEAKVHEFSQPCFDAPLFTKLQQMNGERRRNYKRIHGNFGIFMIL